MPSDTAAVFIAHRRSLVDYATGIIGSRTRAEDVVQEAWFRLNRLDDDDPVREPMRFLYRLVRNLAIDTRRTLARELARGTTDTVALAVADEAPTPEQAVAGKDELRVVLEALAELPERTRIAVRMNRIEGRKLREIADHLDLSVTRTFNLIVEGVAHCDRRRVSSAARRD